MSDLRKEFEALPEIAETIKNGIYYDDRSNRYWSAVGASYVSLARINGAWFAFQEQQKKIDEMKSKISDLWTELDDRQSKEYIIEKCELIIQELLK